MSGDEAKHGFPPDELPRTLPQLAQFKNINIRGLMAMAHRIGGQDVAKRDFALLRQLRDQLDTDQYSNVSLDELSMGMSGDYQQAGICLVLLE